MTPSRHKQVRESIRKIQSFAALGRRVPAKARHGETYGRRIIEAEAERRNLHPETIRQARQLAECYTEAEVNEVVQMIEEHQTDIETGGAIFGKAHLVRLMSVPTMRRREALQRKAIREGWTCSRLELEIAKRMGTRREGGRRPRIPTALADFLIDLEKMTEEWRRWCAELGRTSDEEAEAKHVQLDNLPRPLRRRISEVSEAVAELQQCVVDELKGLIPGWQARRVFRKDQDGRSKKATGNRT